MDLPKPLNCSEAEMGDLLKALISHQLDSSTEDALLLHLRRCPMCLSNLAGILRDGIDGASSEENPLQI